MTAPFVYDGAMNGAVYRTACYDIAAAIRAQGV